MLYLIVILRVSPFTSFSGVLKETTGKEAQARRFADSKFNNEIQTGKVKASSLESFTCVALAGISAEYLKFGYAEGGTGDIQQLDVMLKSLQFTQKKADSEVRCAARCLLPTGCFSPWVQDPARPLHACMHACTPARECWEEVLCRDCVRHWV